MKKYIYTMKDGDGIYGELNTCAHKHFIAENIQTFTKKVGQYIPVEWFIVGEYESTKGEFKFYDEPELFDYEKQLAEDLAKDSSDGIETKGLVQDIINE